MHYLGVAGMPRRIPDYPDAFYVFNKIASWGSYVSAFSVLIFVWVLIDALLFIKTKRRGITMFVVVTYLNLYMDLSCRIIPRRFLMVGLGFGAFLVRMLFIHDFINIKQAIILAYIVPFVSFVILLLLVISPFLSYCYFS